MTTEHHGPTCWLDPDHDDCLAVARAAVDCDVPWTALASAAPQDIADHIASCEHPVHRWDCAWALVSVATNARHERDEVRALHASEIAAAQLRWAAAVMDAAVDLLRRSGHGEGR